MSVVYNPKLPGAAVVGQIGKSALLTIMLSSLLLGVSGLALAIVVLSALWSLTAPPR